MKPGSPATLWLSLVSLLAIGTPARAMQCPTPQPLSRPGILKETKVQTKEMSALLADGINDDNTIPLVVNDLHKRYPGVQNAEIENYLITGYCPMVANLSGLSDSEKQARIDRFVGQVNQIMQKQTASAAAPP